MHVLSSHDPSRFFFLPFYSILFAFSSRLGPAPPLPAYIISIVPLLFLLGCIPSAHAYYHPRTRTRTCCTRTCTRIGHGLVLLRTPLLKSSLYSRYTLHTSVVLVGM
ncbi:hypothetical protein B0H13DRAFT_1936922 [Mycena leptocephala]|nr:hypothetical protein B0H13DRAFT_1936922 [Mycena leptocephala]